MAGCWFYTAMPYDVSEVTPEKRGGLHPVKRGRHYPIRRGRPSPGFNSKIPQFTELRDFSQKLFNSEDLILTG